MPPILLYASLRATSSCQGDSSTPRTILKKELIPAGLVSVQRRLSTPVRRLRRKTVSVTGEQRLEDGTVIPLTVAELAGPLDGSLRGLSWAVVVLAAGLVVIRY